MSFENVVEQLRKANSVLVGMFDASIVEQAVKILGPDLGVVSRDTIARLEASIRSSKLEVLAGGMAQEEEKAKTVDGITGLKNYRAYSEDLEVEVGQAIDENDGHKEKLHVVRFDLGMLNVTNLVGGHSAGDEYKKKFAYVINPLHPDSFNMKDPLVRFIYQHFRAYEAYLIGGDEFSIIIKGEPARVIEYIALLRDKFLTAPYPVFDLVADRFGFKRDSLLDYGMVVLDSQARKDFFANINVPDVHIDEDAAGSITRCAKFLDMTADIKSDMSKMKKRMLLLRKQLAKKNAPNDSNFDLIYQNSVKATFGISELELAKLNEHDNNNNNLTDQYVINTFKNRELSLYRDPNIQDPFLRKFFKYSEEHIDEYMRQI